MKNKLKISLIFVISFYAFFSLAMAGDGPDDPGEQRSGVSSKAPAPAASYGIPDYNRQHDRPATFSAAIDLSSFAPSAPGAGAASSKPPVSAFDSVVFQGDRESQPQTSPPAGRAPSGPSPFESVVLVSYPASAVPSPPAAKLAAEATRTEPGPSLASSPPLVIQNAIPLSGRGVEEASSYESVARGHSKYWCFGRSCDGRCSTCCSKCSSKRSPLRVPFMTTGGFNRE